MNEDCIDFKDHHYAKTNKKLCIYCSYRGAVPSKNNQFCSEICRLLHLSITKDINLKCQDITIEKLHNILDKPYEYKQKVLKINKEGGVLDFD